MEKLKLGLIGLGFIGKTHLRNSLKLSDANLIAVADMSKGALNEATKAGIRKTFTDYAQLLKDPEVDAVIIALPTHFHLECAKRAAEAGKHILLEKPIARNVAEAQEIVSAAKKNSVRLMMGYPLRFNRLMRSLKELLLNGELGDIVTAHATNIGPGPFQHRAQGYAPVPVPEWWFNKKLTGGGALIDSGSHIVNLLRWYFGEIKDIRSYLGYRFNLDLEDHAICLARFASGTTALINVGYFSEKFQLKIELYGTAKHAVADHVPPKAISAGMQMLTMKTTTFLRPYISELEHFVDCVAKDKQPSPSGDDGLRDLEAIELAYRNSIELGPPS